MWQGVEIAKVCGSMIYVGLKSRDLAISKIKVAGFRGCGAAAIPVRSISTTFFLTTFFEKKVVERSPRNRRRAAPASFCFLDSESFWSSFQLSFFEYSQDLVMFLSDERLIFESQVCR